MSARGSVRASAGVATVAFLATRACIASLLNRTSESETRYREMAREIGAPLESLVELEYRDFVARLAAARSAS